MGRLFFGSYADLSLGSKRFLLLAAVALVSASVLMPPVCNLLFKCGCSWLWTTAAAHCNIHNAAPPHCPWCSHGAFRLLPALCRFHCWTVPSGSLGLEVHWPSGSGSFGDGCGDFARWISDGTCHSQACPLSPLDFFVAINQTEQNDVVPVEFVTRIQESLC